MNFSKRKKKFGLPSINKLNNIINLSDITLNDDEKFVLYHGLKFCISHNHIKFAVNLKFLLDNSKTTNQLVNQKKTLYAKLVSVAFNFKETQSSSQKQSLYNEFSKIASNIYNNPNIIISRPDKGNGVV